MSENKPTLREQLQTDLLMNPENDQEAEECEATLTVIENTVNKWLKEELGGLTVIGDEEVKVIWDEYWELYRDLWNANLINEDDYDSGFEYWRKEAQLSHTINELKERLDV